MNYVSIDGMFLKMNNPPRNIRKHMAKARLLGFKSLTEAIIVMMGDSRYGRMNKIQNTIGCGDEVFCRYAKVIEDAGIKLPERTMGFEVTKKCRPKKNIKLSIREMFDMIPESTWLEPVVDIFGSVDAFKELR